MRIIVSCALLACAGTADARQTTPEPPAPAPEVAAIWRVATTPLDAIAETRAEERAARYGAGWASWIEADGGERLLDLRAHTVVRLEPGLDAGVRTSLFAEARRRLDIYTALSDGGRAEQIEFGPAGVFDRIWLEAAMGVAAAPGALALTDTEDGFLAAYQGQVVFVADFGVTDTSACQRPALAGPPAQAARHWLQHVAPIHPDVMDALAVRDGFPCAFTLAVFSPDSPQGRSESWVRIANPTGFGPQSPPTPPDVSVELAGAERASAAIAAGQAALDAADPPPDVVEFFDAFSRLRSAGDLAGALLLATQETHHFGECPQAAIGSARLTCSALNDLALAGIGDPEFERAREGLAAVSAGRHAQAVALLAPFIARDDRAGAAARILTANELVAWGRPGLEAHPELDPAVLLAEALHIDPHAPDVYWHLGRRFLAAGAPDTAWALFDLGRALPGREPTPLLRQTDAMESRMRAVAPHWLPPRESAPP